MVDDDWDRMEGRPGGGQRSDKAAASLGPSLYNPTPADSAFAGSFPLRQRRAPQEYLCRDYDLNKLLATALTTLHTHFRLSLLIILIPTEKYIFCFKDL